MQSRTCSSFAEAMVIIEAQPQRSIVVRRRCKIRHKKNVPDHLERFGKDLGRIWEKLCTRKAYFLQFLCHLQHNFAADGKRTKVKLTHFYLIQLVGVVLHKRQLTDLPDVLIAARIALTVLLLSLSI